MKYYTVFMRYFATGEGMTTEVLFGSYSDKDAARKDFRKRFYSEYEKEDGTNTVFDHYNVVVDVFEGEKAECLNMFSPEYITWYKKMEAYADPIYTRSHFNMS